MRVIRIKGNHDRRGTATMASLAAVVGFTGITGAFLAMAARSASERNAAGEQQRAFFAARSGLAHTIANMNTEGVDDPLEAKVGFLTVDEQGVVEGLGEAGTGATSVAKAHAAGTVSLDGTISLGQSVYWTDVADNGDGTYTVTSTGLAGASVMSVQCVVGSTTGGVFSNAIFAGNEDEDPNYVLPLSGFDAQADEIDGDIYSGGNIEVTQDATISGLARAKGYVSGADGQAGTSQPIPDIESMNYEVTADIKVAELFFGNSSYKSNSAGGYAYQVPESNPAHIFRKNPSDRSSGWSATAKDDYYLEDPYESVSADTNQNGSAPYGVTISGVSGEPGINGNQKVYFIDGNLWLHNKKTYSIGLKHNEPNGVQITFVVKGNIYFSDNFFYEDAEKDGVAFIAIEDKSVADSGNIYLGDPDFGTLRRMNAFMYAQNDFYDYNLDSSGSVQVELYGNMSAGNQVKIERDFQNQHTKLRVDFDERIASQELDMPSLPAQSGAESSGFSVVGWWRGAN